MTHPTTSHKRAVVGALLTTLTLSASAAQAQDAKAREASDASPDLIAVGVHAGFGVSQVFSELGGWPVVGLEVGIFLPILGEHRPLGISLAAHYTAPGAAGTGTLASLGESGADYEWDLQERMLLLELPLRWRFGQNTSTVRPYAMLGPRLYLLESVLTAKGNDGADFGEHRETQTHVGLMAGGGADIKLGPGAVFGGLVMGWSDLNTRITGDSNTGNLTFDVGYRLHF